MLQFSDGVLHLQQVCSYLVLMYLDVCAPGLYRGADHTADAAHAENITARIFIENGEPHLDYLRPTSPTVLQSESSCSRELTCFSGISST